MLLLSGIGPAAELESVGVGVVHDLPGVGKNLHDQLEVYATMECTEPLSYDGQDKWYNAARHVAQWGLFKTGPATATVTEVGAFVNSSSDVRSPDIQLHFLPAQGRLAGRGTQRDARAGERHHAAGLRHPAAQPW